MNKFHLTRRQTMCLRTTLYIVASGAFGVFARWMQLMLAFEDGLSKASFWNFMVPILIIAAGVVFYYFTKDYKEDGYGFPETYCDALHWSGRLMRFLIIAAGALMILGALVLFATCETEKYADLMKVLAGLAVLSALAFLRTMKLVNDPESSIRQRCWCSIIPMLMFCFWLILTYKTNDINSILWDYGIEIVTVCVGILSFFRVAGYAFGVPAPRKTMFYTCFAPFMFIMSIADSRNIGMQIILVAAAFMMALLSWILTANMEEPAPKSKKTYDPYDNDGFERI